MHRWQRRLERVARVWAHHNGHEDLTSTRAELDAEQDFRARLGEWHAAYDYVGARHHRAHFLRIMGTIPDDWPCSVVHPDPCKDWESIQQSDLAAVAFWLDAGRRLYDHLALAKALDVDPAELPLWDDEDYWRDCIDTLVAQLADETAAGDPDAQAWRAVCEGRAAHPDTLASREAYRQRLAERWAVPLAQIPDGTQGGFYALLWRFPQSRRELLRHIRAWHQTQAPDP